MKFDVFGPFVIPRNEVGLIARKGKLRNEFWDDIEESEPRLSFGCGCYVFVLRNRGLAAWYVGKTEKQDFRHEVFQPQKLNHYDNTVAGRKGTPLIFFLPKMTRGGKFSKPSKTGYPSVAYLENFLIGMAVSRNPQLCNKKGTRYLKGLSLPGIISNTSGKQSDEVYQLRDALGI